MKLFTSLILFCLALIPGVTLAQEPVNNFLVGIPGIGDPSGDFDGYIQAIYAMFISIAALLAVVKIIIAGVKYMFTDIVPQKTQAKKDIQGALLGLVVVLGAVLILTVINPELTNFNIEQNEIAAPDPIDRAGVDDVYRGVEDYCSNNLDECEINPCEYTGARQNFACDDACRNENGVPLPPLGAGLPPRCLGSGVLEVGDLLDQALANVDLCGTAGCNSFRMRGAGTALRCRALNGTVISEGSFWGDRSNCVVPRLNFTNVPMLMPCVDRNGIPDESCNIQSDLCETISGGSASIDLDGVTGARTLSCTPPASILPCPQARGEFDCVGIKRQCADGGRTPADIEGRRDAISCI